SKGVLVAGQIWATAANSISFVGPEKINLSPVSLDQPSSNILASASPSPVGFYTTRGVVTFNDRVFNKDYLFVQEDTTAVFVSLKDRHFKNRLEVGQWVELGGGLQPAKPVPVI